MSPDLLLFENIPGGSVENLQGFRRGGLAPQLPDQVHLQFQTAPRLLGQVAVEAPVDQAEEAHDDQCQDDEVSRQDRVGYERVERLVGKELGVIERIPHLPAHRERREKHQRGGMKQKDRLVRIGGPRQPQHGGPDDPFEARPAGKAKSIRRFGIALGDGAQCAIEDLTGIGGGIEEQHDERPKPDRGERAEERVELFQAEEQEIGKEELDEERRAAKDEDEPFRAFADDPIVSALSHRHGGGQEEPGQQGDRAEKDVHDHARADQREMLAQRIAFSRQQPLANTDGAQPVILDGLPAAHVAALLWASPAAVAWPWDSLTISFSSAISDTRVKAR